MREPTSYGYQFGLMGGLDTSSVDDDEAYSSSMVGAEAQAYVGNVTLWAQGAYVRQDEGGSEAIRMTAARGGVRFLVDPTLRLDAEAGYAWGDFDSYDAKVTTWGAGIEKLAWQGSVVGVSLFARYEGAYLDYTGYEAGDTLTEHAAKVGFSLKFGGKDLLEQDRSGANTDMNFTGLSILDSTYY